MTFSFRSRSTGLALWLGLSTPALGATLSVGPGQPYAKPCAAIAAASPGDVIEVDAAGNGSYDGDSCAWSTDNLTVRGINGRASINAGGTPTQASGGPSNISGDKGIFVISAPNATIENFELSGAVSDTCPHSQGCSNNGAGIRHQGTNLTVRNCYIHDNQDGILTGPPTPGTGTILVEFSEFARNGQGDGYSHNLYIGQSAVFTLQYCYSHESVVGHLVKSRAWENHIQYNLLADLPTGTGSYEVDLPQGGLSYVIGNAIEQGPMTQNPNIVSYAEESQANPSQSLFLMNNTIVNDLGSGNFLRTGGSPAVTLINNIFHGAGTVPTGFTQKNNWSDALGDPLLSNPTAQDYQLQAASPCIDAGVAPGTGAGQPLTPLAEYVATASGVTRDNLHWDLGAFEFGDVGSAVDGGFSPADAGVQGSSGSTSAGTTTGASTSASGTTSAGASTSGTSSTSTGSTGTSGKGTSSAGTSSAGTTGAGTTGAGTTGAGTTGAGDGGLKSAVAGGCGCSSAPGSELALLAALLGLWGKRRPRKVRADDER